MSVTKAPIKTEYKGTVFRSKSEAVFARCLDLAGHKCWDYERKAASEIHPWDFCIDELLGEKMMHQGVMLFIEYKPSKPTQTYIDGLKEKIARHFNDRLQKVYAERPGIEDDLMVKLVRDMRSHFAIVWGSPWSPAWPTLSEGDQREAATYRSEQLWSGSFDTWGFIFHGCLDSWGITDETVQQAKSYRFDLQH